jgi:hypothetical protein
MGGHGRAGLLAPRTLAAVALGVGLVVAGCGGSDFARRSTAPPNTGAATTTTVPATSNPALQARLLRSVSLTSSARSARTSISVTLTGLGRDVLTSGAFDVAGTGVVDFVTGNADLKLSVPRFDRLGNGTAIEQRIVGRVAYTRLPDGIAQAAGLPPSVHWLRLDPNDSGDDPSALSQSQADPAGQLAFLRAASPDVRMIGTESVRGVPTTHYIATIDTGTIDTGKQDKTVARLGAIIGTQRFVVDVWLDDAGRARRVVVSVPLSPQSGVAGLATLGANAMLRVQGDYFAFGTPVRVAAPPHAQVRPYGALKLKP